ncbi:MAG TPA: zinc ABC transporter substrate-binding protein [Thermotogota bacterium]|nr:zinc ABC transporter substrate-binding protein [Thermotogota bacterium]HPR95635.1 zinc ABC transporter substrate-binding protein [Thermotogota bacterium]
MRRIIFIILSVLLVSSSFSQLNVVCTTDILADAVKNIGGEAVNVSVLMGSGIDPHSYRASIGDVRAIFGADLIVYSGLHLEGKMTDLFAKFEKLHIQSIGVGDLLDESELIVLSDKGDLHDPHIWFSIAIWKRCSAFIAEKMIEMDEVNADDYRVNLDQFIVELDKLDWETKKKISEIPESARVMITAHDAFNYLGRDYGIEVKGLQGVSTASEIAATDLIVLAEFIVENQIPAVFLENSVPMRNIEALIEAVRAKGYELKLGGELFADSMGTPGTKEGTYIGMFEHNIATIYNGLKE